MVKNRQAIVRRTVILVALCIASGALMAYAWLPPPASPPAGNVPKPLTVGSTPETKNGVPAPGSPPADRQGVIAVNDLFIRALNLTVANTWSVARNFSPYLGGRDLDVRPDQDISVKIFSSARSTPQSPYVSCPSGYRLVGCSGSRVIRSSFGSIPTEENYDYLGTLSGVTWVGSPPAITCTTQVRPASTGNHFPVAYAYCIKVRTFDCGVPGIPCD